ncbi:hypothetical protein QFC22_006261 [Naganishia vaughanmartiniae]|uniref:Uncharacterized protein n=1 Tax=Naganishia vaughanmartiniae TaxID=1424756 RepID=A0ACC2WN68_9TREE|nr:hypothetical protein QFC22_006261 [Naganishia vaughanmartiniae]
MISTTESWISCADVQLRGPWKRTRIFRWKGGLLVLLSQSGLVKFVSWPRFRGPQLEARGLLSARASTWNADASPEFKAVASANADYLTSIKPFLGDRNVTLANMYNVFDYMNVNYIHNKAFRANVTEQQMEQARALADYHEQAVFSSPTKDGIGNIAGQTILPVILEALERFTDSSDPLIMQYIGVAYKPLVSLMNMTEVGIPGFVNYAAVTALELRNTSGTLTISFNFRNVSEAATDGSDYVAYPMFGTSSPELSYSTFSDKLRSYSLASLGEWCNKCGTTDLRGCDVITSLNDTMNDFASATSTRGRHHVSPVAAGLIGALVGIIAALVFMFIGGTLFKKSGGRFGAGKQSQVLRGRSEEADSAYEMDQNDLKSKQHAEI